MEENFEGVEVAIAGLDAVVQGNHEDTQQMFADMKGWLEDRVCQCAPSLVFLASRACAVRLLLWCRFSLFFLFPLRAVRGPIQHGLGLLCPASPLDARFFCHSALFVGAQILERITRMREDSAPRADQHAQLVNLFQQVLVCSLSGDFSSFPSFLFVRASFSLCSVLLPIFFACRPKHPRPP